MTMKALLIHTTREVGSPGPDYRSGYGLVDGAAAATFLSHAASPVAGEIDQIKQSVTYSGSELTYDLNNGTDEGVNVNYPFVVWDPGSGYELFPYSKMIVFLVTQDGKITLQKTFPTEFSGDINTDDYQPEALIIRDAPVLPRTASRPEMR